MKKDNKRNTPKNKKGKEIIDLTSYISPEIINADPNGSYTGVPADMYYNNELDEMPIQDVDDL